MSLTCIHNYKPTQADAFLDFAPLTDRPPAMAPHISSVSTHHSHTTRVNALERHSTCATHNKHVNHGHFSCDPQTDRTFARSSLLDAPPPPSHISRAVACWSRCICGAVRLSLHALHCVRAFTRSTHLLLCEYDCKRKRGAEMRLVHRAGPL